MGDWGGGQGFVKREAMGGGEKDSKGLGTGVWNKTGGAVREGEEHMA